MFRAIGRIASQAVSKVASLAERASANVVTQASALRFSMASAAVRVQDKPAVQSSFRPTVPARLAERPRQEWPIGGRHLEILARPATQARRTPQPVILRHIADDP